MSGRYSSGKKGKPSPSNDFICTIASAVRELLENSINAKCKKITIELDKNSGGCELIRITDDGCGISSEDRMSLCVLRGISQIRTVGMQNKNEIARAKAALQWICWNATRRGAMEICTRTKGEKMASRWCLDSFCKVKDDKIYKEVLPEGTIISVRGLFKGTKSLHSLLSKSSKRNINEVEKLAINFSLMCRNITFNLILVTLDKYSVIEKRQRFRFLDGKGSDLQFLSLITKVQLQNWYRLTKGINGSEGSLCLLLQKQNSGSSLNQKCRHQYLIVNHSIVFLDHGFGKQLKSIIKDLHLSWGMDEPQCWYLQIHYEKLRCQLKRNNWDEQPSYISWERFLAEFKTLLKESLEDFYFISGNTGSRLPSLRSTSNPSRIYRGTECQTTVDATSALMSQCPDKLVSEGIDWTNNMEALHYDHLDSQAFLERSSPPFTMQDPENNFRGSAEDLELTRNSQLSNPFIISRIRPRNSKIVFQSDIARVGNVENAREYEIVFTDHSNDRHNYSNVSLDPNILPNSKESSFTLIESDDDYIHLGSLQKRVKPSCASLVVSDIQMHISLKKEINCSATQGVYKRELVWIFRKGFPTLLLLDGIQEKAEELDSNIDLKLELQPAGWYVIGF